MELQHAASPEVRDVMDAIARTEDLRLSPSGNRLAFAEFAGHSLVVVDIEIQRTVEGPRISFTNALRIASPTLRLPHGVEFIGEDVLVVANRGAGVAIFRLPATLDGGETLELEPIREIQLDGAPPPEAPGSIAILDADTERPTLLVCDNDASHVTRYVLDAANDFAPLSHDVFLDKWLDVPDGIDTSPDGRWIAVSNHVPQDVMVYEVGPDLGPESDPDAILLGVSYPHGLHFTDDGRHLLLADAGSPFVHVYARPGDRWCGVRYPVHSFRVMDDSTFQTGRTNAQEGGPKGIDVHAAGGVMMVTSVNKSVGLFDWHDVLPATPDDGTGGAGGASVDTDLARREVENELSVLAEQNAKRAWLLEALEAARQETREADDRARDAAAREQGKVEEMEMLTTSRSWRLTTPLRAVHDRLAGHRDGAKRDGE